MLTVYTPISHNPDWYWEELAKRVGLESASGGYEDAFLDPLYSMADKQLQACRIAGGRFWELLFNMQKLMEALPHRSVYLLQHLSRLAGQEEISVHGTSRLTLCVPAICEAVGGAVWVLDGLRSRTWATSSRPSWRRRSCLG